MLHRSGDESALQRAVAELFLGFRMPIYRYLLVATGDSSNAEDLTQETFIRLFQNMSRGQNVDNLRAWLFRVAHNLAVDFHRRADTARIAAGEISEEAGDRWRDPSIDVETEILERERMDCLLAGLSPQERRCMELRTQGLRYREIADVLGIRVPTVQTMLARAIRKLMKEVHEKEPDSRMA